MGKYESIIIVSNKINDEARDKVLERIKKYISENGNLESIENLGLKRLAYEIHKHTEAYYFELDFEMEPSKTLELERIYRITEEIIKFIVIRKDE